MYYSFIKLDRFKVRRLTLTAISTVQAACQHVFLFKQSECVIRPSLKGINRYYRQSRNVVENGLRVPVKWRNLFHPNCKISW